MIDMIEISIEIHMQYHFIIEVFPTIVKIYSTYTFMHKCTNSVEKLLWKDIFVCKLNWSYILESYSKKTKQMSYLYLV